jgi:hypothetical protein
MKCLQSLDFFGPPFNFTLFNEEKYKTSIGGFFSLVSFIVSIVFLFIIGSEFFFRENPNFNISNEKPNNYDYITVSKNDFLVAWKITDKNGNKVDITGKIYPFIYYFNVHKTSLSNKILNSEKVELSYSTCNVTTKSEYDSLWDFNNYYCINYDNYKFGGDLENDQSYYFGIYLSYCEDGNDYSSSNSKCLSLETVKSIAKKGWNFEFVYPEYYFKPNDEGNPLKISYSKYSYQLSINLQKKDKFIFHKIISRDDQGFLFSSIKETYKYALHSHEYQYILKDDKELFEEKQETSFYDLTFFFTKDISRCNRSFMKIPDLTAMVGTLIKIEIFFFSLLSNFFGKILREVDIVQRYISFKPEKKNRLFDLDIRPAVYNSNIQKLKNNKIHIKNTNEINNDNNCSNWKNKTALSNSSEILDNSNDHYGNKVIKYINKTDINNDLYAIINFGSSSKKISEKSKNMNHINQNRGSKNTNFFQTN